VYRLSRERQVAVAHLLCEGDSIRSAERLTGVHRDTIMRLMVRLGTRCRAFLSDRLRGLQLDHIQADEILTFVRKKQGRLRPEERADDGIGDQFLVVALDQRTKLIASFKVGNRNRQMTEAFMLDLAARVVAPAIGGTGYRPQISTDGWAAYPGAVDLAFADTVRHGVLIKEFRESEQPGRYGPPELVSETRRPLAHDLPPDAICTSHVERNNLTIRTFMKRFTRLALGFSRKLENLEAAVALHVAHYDFCRFHSAIRSTPAMAAGVAGHPWGMGELLEEAGAQG
jgi:IS1 family transposase